MALSCKAITVNVLKLFTSFAILMVFVEYILSSYFGIATPILKSAWAVIGALVLLAVDCGSIRLSGHNKNIPLKVLDKWLLINVLTYSFILSNTMK